MNDYERLKLLTNMLLNSSDTAKLIFSETDNNNNDIRVLDSFYLKVLPKIFTTLWLNLKRWSTDI